MKIISAENKIIETECIGCSIKNKKIDSIGGVVFESKHFIVTQDIEIPIPAFMILSSKRHISSISDFSKEESQDFIKTLTKVRKVLKKNLSIDTVTLVQKEKRPHFHLWLFPHYKWMESFGDKLKDITDVIEYAKENMKTEENLKEILRSASKLRKLLSKN